MKPDMREKSGKTDEKTRRPPVPCPGGSAEQGYDVKQNIKCEKKHADVQ